MKRIIAVGLLFFLFGCKKNEQTIAPVKKSKTVETQKPADNFSKSEIGSEIMTFKKIECVDDCYYLFIDEKGKDVIIYLPDYCEYNFDDGNYTGKKFKITYDLPKVTDDNVLAQSIELIKTGESQKSSSSNMKSFAEIRSLIISGNKKNMIRQIGEPDEEYSAHDFLKKYYNWKPVSVYTSQRPIGIDVFVYNGIDNTDRQILVIYNFEKSQVTEILYTSDVKSFEDICIH